MLHAHAGGSAGWAQLQTHTRASNHCQVFFHLHWYDSFLLSAALRFDCVCLSLTRPQGQHGLPWFLSSPCKGGNNSTIPRALSLLKVRADHAAFALCCPSAKQQCAYPINLLGPVRWVLLITSLSGRESRDLRRWSNLPKAKSTSKLQALWYYGQMLVTLVVTPDLSNVLGNFPQALPPPRGP